MRDIHFGRLDRVQLTLRPWVPYCFTDWVGHDWRFSWPLLLSLRAWRRLPWREWRFWFVTHRCCNHRCYCPGTTFDGSLVICGFGIGWFLSSYTGPVPCPCDEVCEQLFPSDP